METQVRSIDTPQFHRTLQVAHNAELAFAAAGSSPAVYEAFEVASEARKALIAYIDAQLTRQREDLESEIQYERHARQIAESALARLALSHYTVTQKTAGDSLLNADELAALRRFDECAQDGEGYDVPKEMMRRLSEIGLLRRCFGSHYQATDFGQLVLGHKLATPNDTKGM